jgi:hypothetical protein
MLVDYKEERRNLHIHDLILIDTLSDKYLVGFSRLKLDSSKYNAIIVNNITLPKHWVTESTVEQLFHCMLCVD